MSSWNGFKLEKTENDWMKLISYSVFSSLNFDQLDSSYFVYCLKIKLFLLDFKTHFWLTFHYSKPVLSTLVRLYLYLNFVQFFKE